MTPSTQRVIRTPDQRLRVFVSSTLQELSEERSAAREAINHLRIAPVMFELGARPHPPKDLYRAYLDQSHIFIGIYWQKYGWIAPDMDISGLEDEYNLSGTKPKLIYIKTPAPDREPRLKALLDRIRDSDMAKTAFTAPLKASDFKLKPLTEAQLGLSSVISEGWQQMSAGMYSPSGKTTDQTFLMLQAAPIAPDTFLNFFKQQLSQANYTIEFAPAGTRTANGIDWTLYSAQADVGSIDVALGQKNGTTYLILLSGPLNDRKALVEGVFLPVIDALKPTR